MNYKLLKTISLYLFPYFLLVNFVLFSKSNISLNQEGRKSLHREMVSMDVAIRGLGSGISLGDKKTVIKYLDSLSKIQTKNMHRYEKGSHFWITLMKIKKKYVHIKKIQKEAKKGIKIMEDTNTVDWKQITTIYGEIIQSCLKCHHQLDVK